MLDRLRAALGTIRERCDRALLYASIKAVVAIALLAVAAQHLSGARAFDRAKLERLAAGEKPAGKASAGSPSRR